MELNKKWLDMEEVGFCLNHERLQDALSPSLVLEKVNETPVSDAIEKKLTQFGFSKDSKGFSLPYTVRAAYFLSTLPGVKIIDPSKKKVPKKPSETETLTSGILTDVVEIPANTTMYYDNGEVDLRMALMRAGLPTEPEQLVSMIKASKCLVKKQLDSDVHEYEKLKKCPKPLNENQEKSILGYQYNIGQFKGRLQALDDAMTEQMNRMDNTSSSTMTI